MNVFPDYFFIVILMSDNVFPDYFFIVILMSDSLNISFVCMLKDR
jgi:hypothetical protein